MQVNKEINSFKTKELIKKLNEFKVLILMEADSTN